RTSSHSQLFGSPYCRCPAARSALSSSFVWQTRWPYSWASTHLSRGIPVRGVRACNSASIPACGNSSALFRYVVLVGKFENAGAYLFTLKSVATTGHWIAGTTTTRQPASRAFSCLKESSMMSIADRQLLPWNPFAQQITGKGDGDSCGV